MYDLDHKFIKNNRRHDSLANMATSDWKTFYPAKIRYSHSDGSSTLQNCR